MVFGPQTMVFERSGVHAAGTLPDAFRGCERQEGDPQFRLLDALYHSSGKCNTVNGNETLKRAIRALPGFSKAPEALLAGKHWPRRCV